ISEPYWAKVKIANQPNVDVMIQAFERRVVTYVPSLPTGFQVQMSNIGQHYYDWRYGSTPPPTVPVPPTTTPPATSTPGGPTATPPAPTATIAPTNTPVVVHPATTQVLKQVTVPAHSASTAAIATCPSGSVV